MKLDLRIALLSAFVMLMVFSSCSKTNKRGKWIPKDAEMAFHINGKSLLEKLPWEELKKNPVFTEINADSTIPAFAKDIIDNPENTGIEIKSELIIYSKKDDNGRWVVAAGELKDEAKFKKFNIDASKGGSVAEKDGMSYIMRDLVIVGWKKDRFVYLAEMPDYKRYRDFDEDTVNTATSRDLVAACKDVFDLAEKNSLAKDERFTRLMNTDGDMHFWLNAEEIYKGAEGMDGMAASLMSKFYEGNVTAFTVLFDKGKMNINYLTFMGKELKKIASKYSGGSIDKEMLNRIPSKDVAAVFAFHFNPKGIKELVALTGMESLINMGMVFLGFSIDDFAKANKGDIMFALTGMTPGSDKPFIDSAGDNGPRFQFDMPQPQFVFAASIGDKDAFAQLIRAAKKMNKREIAVPDSSLAYNSNADYFVLSNSKASADQFLNNAKNNDADYISRITGDPVGGYVDLQYLMKIMPGKDMDSSSRITYDAAMKTWNNIYMTGGNYSDGAFSYDISVNMMDNNTNSLKQLNDFIAAIVPALMKERKEQADSDKAMQEMIRQLKETPVVTTPPPAVKKPIKK